MAFLVYMHKLTVQRHVRSKHLLVYKPQHDVPKKINQTFEGSRFADAKVLVEHIGHASISQLPNCSGALLAIARVCRSHPLLIGNTCTRPLALTRYAERAVGAF